MSQWRRTAIDFIPQLRRQIGDADGLYATWIELQSEFVRAYDQRPSDEELITATYKYAAWCLHHKSINVRTAVVCCFYEHLPDYRAARADLHNRISDADFHMLDFAWSYGLKGDEPALRAFRDEYYARKAAAEGVAIGSQVALLNRLNRGRARFR